MNSVFIATSIDGYIADKNNGIDWLNSVPNPDNKDMGYEEFIKSVDAILMGRNTFEIVDGFGIDWPYTIPVFVVSNTMNKVPEKYKGKIELVNGKTENILNVIHNKGFKNLYIDGGQLIQGFLQEDLIDELIITTIPIILGSGIPLFSELENSLEWELKDSKVYLNAITQVWYRRKR